MNHLIHKSLYPLLLGLCFKYKFLEVAKLVFLTTMLYSIFMLYIKQYIYMFSEPHFRKYIFIYTVSTTNILHTSSYCTYSTLIKHFY